MTPKISVIIKSYNHAQFVGQAIESILSQSFGDFEILITDDASSDATVEMIEQFKDERISLEVSRSNRGIALTMNSLVQRAQGQYLAILNSDDYALPGRLETQYQYLEKNSEVCALFGMPIGINEEGRPANLFNNFSVPLSFVDFSHSTWLRHFFFHGNCLCAPTAMIRRSSFLQLGGYDPRYANLHDFDFWIRMAANNKFIHVLADHFTAFRVRSDAKNASAPTPQTSNRSTYEFSQALKQYLHLPKSSLEEIFNQDLTTLALSQPTTSERLLAELALQANTPHHHLFALDTLFGSASHTNDLKRLHEIAGLYPQYANLMNNTPIK